MTPDELRDVNDALNAVEGGNAGHWPTVAAVLRDEVIRLRVADRTCAELAEQRDEEIASLQRTIDRQGYSWMTMRDAAAARNAERDQARSERDRLSALLRGMARRASYSRRLFRRRASRCNIFMHERNFARAELARLRAELAEEQRASAELAHQFNTVDAELARLRERAVVLPEDWRKVLTGVAPEAAPWIVEWIESWRPSTGDTDGTRARAELRCTATTTHPLYGRVQCQVQRGHEGIHGRLHSNSHFGVHWEDAVFPEEHAEPEPAWGVDRPVHGHTEQTGDQT